MKLSFRFVELAIHENDATSHDRKPRRPLDGVFFVPNTLHRNDTRLRSCRQPDYVIIVLYCLSPLTLAAASMYLRYPPQISGREAQSLGE
jgi:hypothetical protein